MKKKKLIKLILIIILISSIKCHALTKSELTTLNLDGISTIDKPENYTSVQGGTTTDKYIITIFINQNEDSDGKCAIMLLNKDNYKQVRLPNNPIKEYNFGHANDATYNSLTNELVVLSGKKLNFLDLNDDKFTLTRKVDLEYYYHGVGYDNESNQYVLARSIENGTLFEIRNDNFEIIDTFELKTNLTHQSLTIHQGNIYYVCYEAGRVNQYQTVYDGLLKRKENLIYVYNMEGKKQTIYYIPYSYKEVIFGEIENISFNNDKMLIQFNHANKAGYFTAEYRSEISTNLKVKVEDVKDNTEYGLYLDDEEIEVARTNNNKLEFYLTYTEEGTYEYTLKQLNKKEKKKEDKENNTAEEDNIDEDNTPMFSGEEFDPIKKPLEVNVFYDPVVNKLKTRTNAKDLVFQQDYFYSKTELRKLQESQILDIPDTGIN